MDEADQQPVRHEIRLPRDHLFIQRAIRVLRRRDGGIVAGDDVIGQQPHRVRVAAGGVVLKGADADMARRHAGQDGAGERGFARHDLAGHDRGQGARGRYAQGGHGFADEVFAQHGAQGGAAIAAAGEGSAAGALELDVESRAVRRHDFPQQDRAPIAQLGHEMAELVARVGERDRRRALRHAVAGQDRHTFRAGEGRGVEPQPLRQRRVHADQSGLSHRRRVEAGVEVLRQAGVAVVEGKMDGHAFSPQCSVPRWSRWRAPSG